MKGRLYKPIKKYSLSEKNLKPRVRPWKDSSQVPLVYFWKSSIPEKYFQHKSRILRHISETNRTKNTQEFLKKSQKYIEIIADSHRHTPSMRASMLNSRNDSIDELEQASTKKPKILLQPGKELNVSQGPTTERVEKSDKLNAAEKINFRSVRGLAKNEVLGGNQSRVLVRRLSMYKYTEKEKETRNFGNFKWNAKGGKVLPGKEMGLLSAKVNYTINLTNNRRGSVS